MSSCAAYCILHRCETYIVGVGERGQGVRLGRHSEQGMGMGVVEVVFDKKARAMEGVLGDEMYMNC